MVRTLEKNYFLMRTKLGYLRYKVNLVLLEFVCPINATLYRCSKKMVFWKYAANLQENIHAEVWIQ